jgi:hypothetical protein
MSYQNQAQTIPTGCWLLSLLIVLSGCVTTTTTAPLPSLPCPITSTNAPLSVSQNQAMMTQASQKRLQDRERTIAAQTQQRL